MKTKSASQLNISDIDLLSVMEGMDDGVIITDRLGDILFFNSTQAQIDGLSADDVIGLNVTDVYDLTAQTSKIIQCITHQKTIKNITFFYKTMSGKLANTVTSVYPLFKADQIIGAICFSKDYQQFQQGTTFTRVLDQTSHQGNGTRYTFSDIIGKSPEFLKTVSLAQKVSKSQSTVMLIGETGTGKELFAQSIHNNSPRHTCKYVAVNCAAIPGELLEGMLFGTSKGAFTGAPDKPGLFETANGGTLFLDELLAMPINLQAKLLRVIQERKIRRVGSLHEKDVDLRIISSICDDPRLAIKKNLLRTDLFYRLGVVIIKIPPLRNRRLGIQDLVNFFIQKYNPQLGTNVKALSNQVLERFMEYQWPGNVRELQHLIERAMNAIVFEEIIDLNHFSSGLEAFQAHELSESDEFSLNQDALATVVANPLNQSHTGLTQTQTSYELDAVSQALSASQGNITKAATTLKISRQLLNYKMKKHGLSRKDFIRK